MKIRSRRLMLVNLLRRLILLRNLARPGGRAAHNPFISLFQVLEDASPGPVKPLIGVRPDTAPAVKSVYDRHVGGLEVRQAGGFHVFPQPVRASRLRHSDGSALYGAPP